MNLPAIVRVGSYDPTNQVRQIEKRASEFRHWLSGNGAQILEPTNEWEIIRFRVGVHTAIIYRKKNGALTFVGHAKAAWDAFCGGVHWRVTEKTQRPKRTSVRMTTIRKRDGDLCFFCQRPVSAEDGSLEHLVAITHQGPNHISNLFLAHKTCNAKAGHLSAPEKIRLHVQAVIERNQSTEKSNGISQ